MRSALPCPLRRRWAARGAMVWPIGPSLSGRNYDLQAPLHVVGDGRQADLNACLCKPSPSHPAQSIASFPCAENLLDPTAYAMDRSVPGIQTGPHVGFIPTPHTSCDDARPATFGDDGLAKMIAAISTVGINIAWIVWQCIRTSLAVIHVGRCDGDLLDKSRIGICANMRLETVDCRASSVFDPTTLAIIFTCRSDNRRIDKRAGLNPYCPCPELAGDQSAGDKAAAEPDERRALRRGLRPGDAALGPSRVPG